MNRSTIQTILLGIALLAIAVVLYSGVQLLMPHISLRGPAAAIPIVANEREVQPLLPARLSIPVLGINASVEHVGVTASGNMGTPQNFDAVGWYKYGAQPGAVGKAVIAGHLDDARGHAAVFAHLEDVVPGDLITVSDAAGKNITFRVVALERYPYDDAPLKRVFGSSDKPELILITCEGEWNQQKRTYEERLIVYAVVE